MSEATTEARGWQAAMDLHFNGSGARTVITRRRHVGPLRIQKPFYPGDGACHVYLLHPPGGLVGGDVLDVTVRVGLKETEPPVPLCYCFGHTAESVRDEIVATGRSTVPERITVEVQAGKIERETRAEELVAHVEKG